ncbi:TyrS-associated PheT N-terminal domain-related protein TapR [Mycoplasmopsis columbina]|uniref:TyrS-associated PheT N-terminal domain-related protein TapR n=1 Tax=Mycoplasmopsis columbina TaxID=114881 RepID=UPI0004A71421|nr:hypothetical protein [Mycoplasmopsis columbina]VEU77171.1 phenylalanyl-tRNA synthetase subunit beta [Mycoplasmopsis columbina]
MIFFNLNNKYKNTNLIFVDTRVKPTQVDFYETFSILRDDNFNIKLINFFHPVNLENDYQILDKNVVEHIKKEVLVKNNDYKFNNEMLFALGKIIKREVHPKSEKLAILTVEIKNRQIQIVTNTTYTLENMYFVFALPGSITAKGEEILEGSLLNVKSEGMLASVTSLGLTKDDNFNEFEKFIKFINKKEVYEKYFNADIQYLIEVYKKSL